MGKTIKEIKEKRGQKNAQALEYKKIKITLNIPETKADEDKGTIEAYVSIFDNVDLGGDKIIKGAFSDSLQKKLPKGVWMHNWEMPIAKTIEAREDEKGLYIKGQFNLETQRGKEAYSDLKFGTIDEFSIGFRIQEYSWEKEDDEEVRIIKKIKLYEWSPVLAGMNPDTELISVKEEEKKAEPKAKFVYVNQKKRLVKIYLDNDTTQEIKMSYRYFKYLKTLDEKGAKVEPMQEELKKILRIRQVVKQIDKGAEYLLRITK